MSFKNYLYESVERTIVLACTEEQYAALQEAKEKDELVVETEYKNDEVIMKGSESNITELLEALATDKQSAADLFQLGLKQ